GLPPGFGLGNASGGSGSGISLLKNATIKADEDNNALIVTAPPDVLRDLESVINQLDVRRAQVLVEAVIVEVQDADGLNLGVQWFNSHSGGTIFQDSTAITNLFPSKDNPVPSFATALKGTNGFAAGFYHGNWAGLLTALASNSKNDILATPSVVTVDNAVANLSVGQDVPILTGTQSDPTGGTSNNVFNSVSRRTVGIKLLVKPQINTGDSVMLQIAQEVSSVADQPPAGTDKLGASFNTRSVNNTVLVKSGETVVIGGILDNTVTDTVSKVPLLGDIPGLGVLFRSSKKQSTKRNLMLFIRPTVIRDNDDFQEQSVRKYDQFHSVYQNDLNRSSDKLPPQLDRLQEQQRSREAFDRVQKNINQFFTTE
ncbi:MAG: secretin N-terminal domain-containing protein, partial [Enterobacteriaceae bacterium]